MTEYLIALVTVVVTWILGVLAKKSEKISDNLIPIQNLAIGVIVTVIEFIITKDFSIAIAVSGLTAGGMYDIVNNLKKMRDIELTPEESYELSNNMRLGGGKRRWRKRRVNIQMKLC